MSTKLSGPVTTAAQNIHVESADQMHNLGEIIFSNDGRAFRYAKAGATALVAGTLQQAAAEDTADQNIAATAAAVDDTSITTAAMTVTANQYAEGLVLVTVTPGVGLQYRISGHAAYTAAAATFKLDDPIKVALTTTSRLDFVSNPYKSVIINPTTLTSVPVGVATFAVTAAYYAWLQVGGVANILADGANAVGSNLVASNGVAGAVEDAAAPGAQPLVGTAVTGAADTEYGAVKLQGLI